MYENAEASELGAIYDADLHGAWDFTTSTVTTVFADFVDYFVPFLA